ncbi:hypothetical protein [Natronomonas gomsonensis]|uniref:hypothetical protein n=1 Tax=Natronomonas gomsonensis TaxID=1046043 RepID=UPI0015BF9A4B|nr:hypothetical protein [Natronomonas gomsonensis]
MSDALQRTIRRCTAVLAIPLSLYPLVFVARLETDGYPYTNLILEVADEIALAVLVGAVGYLVVSVLLQFIVADPAPSQGVDDTGAN